MACEYCNWETGHPSSCPNADESKYDHYCSICGEGICEEEEYIVNDDGKYIHFDCPTMRELVEFLGGEIQIMRGDEY